MGIKRKKRSGFEEQVAAVLEPEGFEYEPFKVAYHTPHYYTPDFVFGDVLVEVKGYFRPGDTQKYKAINDSLVGKSLVFLLQYPDKRVRKGSLTTMADWCDKNGIEWYTIDDIELLLVYAGALKDDNV